MRIPTHGTQQSSLTTDVSRATIDPKAAGQTGEMVSEMGKDLASLGEHFQKLRDEQEITAAKVALSKATDQIHVSSLKDPDVWGQPEKIETMYQDAASAAGERITSSEAKMKFQNESQLIIERKRTSLMTGIMNRQSNLYKGTYVDRINQLATEYETSLPQDQAVIRQEMEREKQNAISIGGVNAVYAQTHLQTVLNQLGGRTLKSDLGSADASPDPVKQIEAIESELKKGDSGKYKDIPKEKRDAAFREVTSAKTRAEKTVPERQRLMRHLYDKSMTEKYANGELTEENLIHSQNKMSPERFKMLAENLINGNMATQHNPEEYARMIDFISNDKNTERDCLNEIIQAENSGKIMPDEAKSLVKMFMISSEDDPNFKLSKRPNLEQMLSAQSQKDDTSKEKRTGLGAWWKSLWNHDQKNATENAKKVVKAYNDEPNKAVKDAPGWGMIQADKIASQDRLKKFPSIASFPEEGRVINGWRFYPDGRAVEEPNENSR